MILFLGSQPASNLVINPMVGCCYYPSGPQLLSQLAKEITHLGWYQITLLGEATEAPRCTVNSLPKATMQW